MDYLNLLAKMKGKICRKQTQESVSHLTKRTKLTNEYKYLVS